MRANLYAASICAAMTALIAGASDAGAAPKTKQIESASQAAATTRHRARVTVERRSFLDAGTEVRPGERKFTDYAFPPGYSPIGEALGPGRDYNRQPLLDPWDFPGYSNVWWRRY
jgi:hypothetical protein